MRKIASDQLDLALKKGLPSVCLLTGEDPLLLIEAEDMICQSAYAQGFDEKYRQTIDNTSDWESIFERVQSMGLFFQRQILYLQLPENLNVSLQEHLQRLIACLNEDCLLILHLAKLNKSLEKQKWFSLLENNFLQNWIISCQTPSIDFLPQWINARVKKMEMHLDQESVQLLCYSYEGNLLALKQVLSLLNLLYPKSKITLPRVQQVIEKSAQFNVYQWIDALLIGNVQRAQQILTTLQQTDIQSVILLRTLQREILLLLRLSQQERRIHLDAKLDVSKFKIRCDQLKIWQNRRHLLMQALKCFSYRQLFEIVQELANLERKIKAEFSQDIWEGLRLLSCRFCSRRI